MTSDILERNWDPHLGTLHTTRLVLKRGSLPNWAPRGIIEKSETWVLEDSTINLIDGTMSLRNRNVDHRLVMEVTESTTLRERDQVTDSSVCVQVMSSWGFYVIRRRIEQYGIKRFKRQTMNSRRGLLMTIHLLHPGSSLREKLLNSEQIHYPAGLAPSHALRRRLLELRKRANEKKEMLSEILLGGMTKASHPSETEEDVDPDEEFLTQEEESELRSLEIEFSPENQSPNSSVSNTSRPLSRWFWWLKWNRSPNRTPAEQPQPESSCHSSTTPQADTSKR